MDSAERLLDDEIYKQLNYEVLKDTDMVEKLWDLCKNGNYRIDVNTGKLTPNMVTIVADPPWIYTRPKPGLNCGHWHSILFKIGGVFPEECLKCWKVVVRPRTVEELIMLLIVQKGYTNRYCKCGVERRDYVEADYGGYFYCESKEEGLEVLDEVRALVSEHISPDVPVTLKRYCTEYEVAFGPTDLIEQRLASGEEFEVKGVKKTLEDNRKWIAMIDECVDSSFSEQEQPPWVRGHVLRTWLERAEELHDLTCRKFNDGQPCRKEPYAKSVTYERED